ncbi:MAG: glycoside hydrolase [Patescibacteria group bacterium]|nr:glycoside hydrolase [Patescibacteria group bacterium]
MKRRKRTGNAKEHSLWRGMQVLRNGMGKSFRLLTGRGRTFFLAAILITTLAVWQLVTWRNTVLAVLVTIDDTVSTTTTEHLHTGHNVVFIDDQNGYLFYVDSDGRCKYSKTTDGGNTWGTARTVDNQTDCQHPTVWYDRWTPEDTTGTYIYILTQDVGADDLWFNRLDTTTDTLWLGTAPISISTDKTNTLTNNGAANLPSITKGTDGDLYMGMFDGGTTGDTSWVKKCSSSCGSAANWIDPASFTVTNDPDDDMILVPLAGGNIMMIRNNDTDNDMEYAIFNDASNTWSSFTDIDANAPDNLTYDGHMSAIVLKSNNDIYLAYVADNDTLGTNDDIRTWIYDGSTWTAGADVLTNSSLGVTGVRLTYNQNNGDVYAIYSARTTAATASTGRVYYKLSTDNMASWGTQTGPLNTTAEDIYGLAANHMSDQRMYAAWYGAGLDDYWGETVEDIAPAASAYEQSAYRFFVNTNSTDVGSPLAAANSPATLTTKGDQFRLRMLIHITGANLAVSGQNLRLQFAERGGGSCSSPAGAWTTVGATTDIAWYDNTTPADGAGLTANANDPTNAGFTIVNQSYTESSPFTNNQSAINIDQDGKWDFSLRDYGATGSGTYCFRITQASGTLLDTYTVYPEITIAASPTYTQSDHRFYANTDTTDVGTPLAAENTSFVAAFGQAFRMRMLMNIDTASLAQFGRSFNLEYALKGSGTCDAPEESYTAITTTTEIAWNDNATPADDAALTPNANDPDNGRTVQNQTYVESNPFDNGLSLLTSGNAALWDFSLTDFDMRGSQTYCLRLVRSGGTPLDSYASYAEVEASPGRIDLTPSTVQTNQFGTGSTVVFTTDQVGYVFYTDSTGQAVYRKTNDGGISWNLPVVVDAQTDVTGIQVWYDRWTPGDTTGNYIHIITLDSSADDIWYNRLDTASDVLLMGNSPVSAVSNSGQAGSLTSGQNLSSITRATNGTLYAGLIDDSDNYVVRCSANCNLATSWTEAGTAPFANSNDNLILLPQPSDNILAIRWNKANNRLESRRWINATSTWETAIIFDASSAENTTYTAAMGAVVEESFDVHLVAVQDHATLGGNNDDIVTYQYDPTSATWSSRADVLTNDSRGITDAKIFWDPTTGDYYVVYAVQETPGVGSTGNIYWKRSINNTNSWGPEQGPLTPTQSDIYGLQTNITSSERVYYTYFENGADDFLGGTLLDLNSSSMTPGNDQLRRHGDFFDVYEIRRKFTF